MAIFRVFPDNITPLWPQLQALLEPALELVRTHDPEHVRAALMTGQTQLFAQIENDLVEACAVTEFMSYPKGMFVRVWMAGARDDKRMDTTGFYTVLRQWAEAHQCQGFEAIGRHGWLRKVPGAKVEGLVMREVFDQ